jgi:myo-inositol-1(or 4)-monophosphatase
MNLTGKVSSLAKIISNEVLLPNFAKVKVDLKADGSWLTVADTLAHQRLTESLPQLVDCPVLSEELPEQEQRAILASEPKNYWCIDPLDGTSNFANGIPYWCMSIALIQDGVTVLGVVYDPNRDECFSSDEFTESRLNGQPIHCSCATETRLSEVTALIDFKRLKKNKAAALVANPPYRSQRSFGASALDLCWIATGRCQIYVHGQQKIWDYAAGLLILCNANGVAETFDRLPVFANDLSTKSVIGACEPVLMDMWTNHFHRL